MLLTYCELEQDATADSLMSHLESPDSSFAHDVNVYHLTSCVLTHSVIGTFFTHVETFISATSFGTLVGQIQRMEN